MSKRRIASGSWIVDARKHLCNYMGVELPSDAIKQLSDKDNKAASWIIVEIIASAMDKAYREALEIEREQLVNG